MQLYIYSHRISLSAYISSFFPVTALLFTELPNRLLILQIAYIR